jgi:hypothetical protein
MCLVDEGEVQLMRYALASPELGSASAAAEFGGNAAVVVGVVSFLLEQQIEQGSVDGSELVVRVAAAVMERRL